MSTTATSLTLRDYQEQALDAIAAARAQGSNRLLVSMATGLGKTVCFSQMLRWPALKAWLDSLPKGRGATMLVVAHREELINQAAEKIHRANPDLVVDVEQADQYASRYSDVVVASIQTLSAVKFRRLQRLLQQHTFRIVVADEAHHFSSATNRTALVHLGFLPPADASETDDLQPADYDDVDLMMQALTGWDDGAAPKDRLLVGFTATTNRADGVGLGAVFQGIPFTYPLKKAIDDKWLVPIVPWYVETVENLDGVKKTAGDFNQKELAQAVNTERRNWLAVKAYQQYADKRPAIAFTVDVQHAHDLAATFAKAGVRAVAISAETPKEDRRVLQRQYSAGQIDVLANCAIFLEGVDLPLTSCIVMAKPTQSATLYEQAVGRGLRLFEQKQNCVLIDLVDVARKHSLMTAPMLYGLPPNLKTTGKDLRELADQVDQFLERNPGFNLAGAGRFTMDELLMKARSVDLWTVPKLAWKDCKLNWIKVGPEDYRLQFPFADGIEVLKISRDLLGHYDLSATIRPAMGGQIRQRTLAVHIPSAEAAAKIAETFMEQERAAVIRLKSKDAHWRSKRMSDRQRQMLERYHIPHSKHTDMGTASDLIDLHMARKGK